MTTTEAFDRGAARYDLMVALNPGYHRELRRVARSLVERLPDHAPQRLLDLACGSGASTRALLQAAPADAEIIGIDASQGMLDQARAKSWPKRVYFRQGVCGELDVYALGRQSFSGVQACYLFRNVPPENRDRAIAETFDVLEPGGWLAVQEYSVAGNPVAGRVWDAVSNGVIIPLGTLVDQNPELYRYLRQSVIDFDAVAEFADRLHRAGFEEIAYRTAKGWQRGILHTVIARKPLETRETPSGETNAHQLAALGHQLPGRDRRAVYHPAASGLLRPSEPREVAVVGGGIAGIAAATILAERGVKVALYEHSDRIGGRVAAWPLPDGRSMSRGFHAFFRQYYNLRSLLRRLDPSLGFLIPIEDYPLQRPGGLRDSFTDLPKTPPWSVLEFVRRSPSFTLKGLSQVNVKAATELLRVHFPGNYDDYDGESAAAFLDRLKFPQAARDLALEVFARSFFADPKDFSAGELVAMFHTYFMGSAEGLLFDVPSDDYESALWAPFKRHLETMGVTIRLQTPVEGLGLGERPFLVVDGANQPVDGIVLAADPRSARALIGELQPGTKGADPKDRDIATWQGQAAATTNAPPFIVVRLWFDGLLNSDRPEFVGTSGYGPLDNVSILNDFEAEAAAWTQQHGGSVVELHAYACPMNVMADQSAADQVVRDLERELLSLYPEVAELNVLHREVLVKDDCTLIGPARWADRPGVKTPDPRLVLAGDWVRTDYPVALMERAATTGMLAANALLETWGVQGEGIWTVPMKGLLRR